ncbi:MAG: hypothetical protein AAGD22_11770, partial [Verrucomicrobiota bacterium]
MKHVLAKIVAAAAAAVAEDVVAIVAVVAGIVVAVAEAAIAVMIWTTIKTTHLSQVIPAQKTGRNLNRGALFQEPRVVTELPPTPDNPKDDPATLRVS